MYPSNMQVNYNDNHMFSQGKQRRNRSCELVHLMDVKNTEYLWTSHTVFRDTQGGYESCENIKSIYGMQISYAVYSNLATPR